MEAKAGAAKEEEARAEVVAVEVAVVVRVVVEAKGALATPSASFAA